MSGYPLSVVLLIPSAYRDALNAIAEGMGWGPNNMSVSLSGGTWWGCHTMAAPEFLADVANAPAEAQPVLAAAVISVSDPDAPGIDGQALMGLAHWNAVLLEHGLSADDVAV